MLRFLETPEARLIIWAAALAIVVAIATYTVARVRDGLIGQKDSDADANELLAKFRELHSQGHLSNEEFRTIKTRLANELQNQVERKDRTGCRE